MKHWGSYVRRMCVGFDCQPWWVECSSSGLYIQDGKEQLCVAGIPMLEAMQVRTIHYVINGQMYRLGSNF